MLAVKQWEKKPMAQSARDAELNPPARSGSQLRVALLCALVALCDGFDTQAIAFVAPVIAREWGVEPGAFGPIFSAGLAGLALGAFVFGSLADRIGRRAVILLCVTLFGLASLATTQASSMGELAAWRILTGLGLGGVLPNLIAVTNESATDRQKNSLVMLMFCGFPLGATIGGIVSAPLIEAAGWESVFITGGIAPLAILPLLFRYLPRGTIAQGSVKAGKVSQLFSSGRAAATLLLWTAFFSNLLVMYFLVNWLPSLLSMVGTTLSIATLSTAMLNLGGIAGAFILSRLINGERAVIYLACAYLFGMLSLLLIAQSAGNMSVMLIGAGLAGSIVVGGQIAMNAIAASLYPAEIRSTGVGWALGIGRIGSIIGPLIGGLLIGSGWVGTSPVLFAMVPTFVAAAALFALSRLDNMRLPVTGNLSEGRTGTGT
jgi:AAHS family 4-hydroxybenzoate transporter-like MFS transporter